MQKEGIAKKPQTLCREHRAKDGSHPLPPALPSGGKCDRFFVCFLCAMSLMRLFAARILNAEPIEYVALRSWHLL